MGTSLGLEEVGMADGDKVAAGVDGDSLEGNEEALLIGPIVVLGALEGE